MNLENVIKENNWRVTYRQQLGHFLVLERGVTILIIYPKSNKFKERQEIKIGIEERLKRTSIRL